MDKKAIVKTVIVFSVLIVGAGLVSLGQITSAPNKKPKTSQKYTPPATAKDTAMAVANAAAVGSGVVAEKSKSWWAAAKTKMTGWMGEPPPAAVTFTPAAAVVHPARSTAVAPAPLAPVVVAAPVAASVPPVAPVAAPVVPAVVVAHASRPPKLKAKETAAPAQAGEATPDLDKLMSGLNGILKK